MPRPRTVPTLRRLKKCRQCGGSFAELYTGTKCVRCASGEDNDRLHPRDIALDHYFAAVSQGIPPHDRLKVLERARMAHEQGDLFDASL